jgi:hypothetical protein
MPTIDEEMQRYLAAMHAMQSGVAAKMSVDGSETSPKHLRVGINGAMSDHGALAKLLVDKGLISEEEYVTAIADGAEREQEAYEKFLSEHYGRKVTLG